MESLSTGFLVPIVGLLLLGCLVLAGLLFRARTRLQAALRAGVRMTERCEDAELAEMLIDHSPDGIVVVDETIHIVKVNAAYCRMTGRSKEECIGLRASFPGWNSGDKSEIEQKLAEALRGDARPFETTIGKKDGGRLPVLFSPGTLRTKRGSPYHFAIMKDISERKRVESALQESEARLRTAVDSIPFDLFMLDRDGRYCMLNAALRKNWGGDVIGKRPRDLDVDPATSALWETNNRRAFAGEVVTGDVAFEVKGETRFFHNIVSPVRDGPDIRGVLGVNVDITARKRSEEALALSEDKFRKAFHLSPDSMVLLTAEDERFVEVNHGFERVFGYARDEVIGKTSVELGLWPDMEGRARVYASLADGNSVHGMEMPFRAKSGAEGTCELSASEIVDVGGERYYLGVVRDVTERNRLLAELRKSDEKYRLLVENTGAVVTFWSLDGRLLLINQTGARILGRPAETLVGLSLQEFFPEKTVGEVLARREEVQRTGAPGQFEGGFELGPSERRYRSFLANVSDASGGLLGTQIVSLEITDLVKAEQALREKDARLRLVFEQLPAILWTTDRELRVTSITGGGLGDLGLTPERVLGTTLMELLGSDDPEFQPIVMHRKSLAGEPATFEIERNHRVWETHCEPLRNEHGEIIGCLAIGHDVTDRRRAEREIARSREQLRALAGRLHEVREEESSSISREIHDELGQALAVLKWEFSGIGRKLDEAFRTGETARLKARVEEVTRKIDATIDTVKRISAQLRPLILDDLGLVGAIEWHAADFQRRTGIRCEFRRSGLDADALTLDSQRSTAAFRILQEILTNVLRHAQASRVTIDLRREEDGAVLDVRDDGMGMPPDAATRRGGLGILGMRERALVFGGSVSIRGEPGRGTHVRVVIPIGEGR